MLFDNTWTRSVVICYLNVVDGEVTSRLLPDNALRNRQRVKYDSMLVIGSGEDWNVSSTSNAIKQFSIDKN